MATISTANDTAYDTATERTPVSATPEEKAAALQVTSVFEYSEILPGLYLGSDPAVTVVHSTATAQLDELTAQGHYLVDVPSSDMPRSPGMRCLQKLDVTASAQQVKQAGFDCILNFAAECPDLGPWLLQDTTINNNDESSRQQHHNQHQQQQQYHILQRYQKTGLEDHTDEDIERILEDTIQLIGT